MDQKARPQATACGRALLWSSPPIIRQRRIALEHEIARSRPPLTSRAGGGRRDDDDAHRWPDSPPPLSVPAAALYLPRGDY
jgi:hypothetical protein